MNGCVINATPIAVDFWRPAKAPQARLFFLTHFHTDHLSGLTSSWRFPLYTSPITALLLKRKYKLPNSVVIELEVGQSYLLPLDEGGINTVTVTVLDANHVPGAVMFLFQGYFGNILYCGDMRWNPEMLEDQVLQNVVQHRELDVLYMDNTYSAPYCQFPSREEAKQQIFEIIDMFPDHEIKIGINNLGREKLLEDIAQRYGERILVSQNKFEELKLLGCLDVFTTDSNESRIHTVPMKQMQVASHQKWCEKYQTISIIPTALFVGWKNGPYSTQASNGMHVVPYSEHSSYSELIEMVSQLAPHQIFPVVQGWSQYGWWADASSPDQNVKTDMTVYRHLLSLPPPDPVVIPEGVIKVMASKAPRLLKAQPRRCVLRRGLSPRRIKSRGVIYSSPASCSSSSMLHSPTGTPTSFTTMESSRSDLRSPRQAHSKESPRLLKHGVKSTLYSVASHTKHLPENTANEIHNAHVVPDEMHSRENTPTHFSDSHTSGTMVIEENQPTSLTSCTRVSVAKGNSVDSKQQPGKQPVKRALLMESPEEETSDAVKLKLKKKKKEKKSKSLSMRKDSLLRETQKFIKLKIEYMNSPKTYTDREFYGIVRDYLMILKACTYLQQHQLL